jgi:hypothetical protein
VRSSLPAGTRHSLERKGEWAHLHVPPLHEQGFSVHVNVGQTYAGVVADRRLMFDFLDPEEDPAGFVRRVVALTTMLLGPNARIRVSLAGSRPYRWILEERENGTWIERKRTRSLLMNPFAPRSELTLQNRTHVGLP